MTCHSCRIEAAKFGKHRNGLQRYRCAQCRKTFTEPHERTFGDMYTNDQKGLLALQLLLEGNSVRSVERITGVHRDTILRLLLVAGERCERLMSDRIRDIPVRDVQCDEIWGFVFCKEKNKPADAEEGSKIGDAYTFVAIERYSKLILAWHLGRRTSQHTQEFMEKLRLATKGRFQLTSDGFAAYPDAVQYSVGMRVDFAQLIKIYAAPRDGEQRYSPAEVIRAVPKPILGNPNPEQISTSHVERQNLTMRMQIRRLTRLTNAFSKNWEGLRSAVALHFAYYNFCRVHRTLRITPAMAAELADRVWDLRDLLA